MEAAGETIYAICLLKEDGASGVSGVTYFTQEPGKDTLVQAKMTGLTAGKHGFHVHKFGKYFVSK
jgi:Cu-Zn family superoxide dismutase